MPRKRRRIKAPAERKKPGVTPQRFRTDPAFRKSRLAAGDFGRASQCAVLLRKELVDMLDIERQDDIHRGLSQFIGRIIREKRASGAQRMRLNDIDWKRLEEKDFNTEAGVGTLLFNDPGITVDPASGKIEIVHPSFMLTPKVMKRKDVTHVRIIAGAAAIDFDKKKTAHDYAATEYFPKGQTPEGKVNLSMQLPAPIKHPLFIVLGVRCAQQERSKQLYPSGNRRYKALCIVHVRPAPPPAYKVKAILDTKKSATAKTTAPKKIAKPVKKSKTAKKKK